MNVTTNLTQIIFNLIDPPHQQQAAPIPKIIFTLWWDGDFNVIYGDNHANGMTDSIHVYTLPPLVRHFILGTDTTTRISLH